MERLSLDSVVKAPHQDTQVCEEISTDLTRKEVEEVPETPEMTNVEKPQT